MEAISITQTKSMILEPVKQPLFEKIEESSSQIHQFLIDGDIHSATDIIRNLSNWSTDLIWTNYLTTLFSSKIILSWLRTLGAQKGYRFISYQTIFITLATGTKIQVRSPFFIKASPKRGRKKRGPQKRGAHLLLMLMGFVHKVDPQLAFRAIELAVLAPSFDTASKILEQQGAKLSPNKIRSLVTEINSPNLDSRVKRLLDEREKNPFENQRVLIAVDGGRLRRRKNKRGPIPSGNKRRGFHTDWIEPKLFTIHILDQEGNIIKNTAPFVDGTTGKLKAFMALLEQYLTDLGIERASEVILVGDGAPWIWERIPKLIRKTGGNLKLNEIIDWTHAKQNLIKAFETLSKKNFAKVNFNYFKDLLFAGKITKIVDKVKSLLKVTASSKIMKKLKSYFVSNENRMQYETNQVMKLPIGSGVIESAIRRVVNMRIKSPGSFWKPVFAETMIYLRSQLLYGRWKNLKNSWTKLLLNDFREIAMASQCVRS